jgi:hypothetical protein
VAIQRSRDLMTGLRSAGRALAIRHLALAAFAIADVFKSIGFLWHSGPIQQANVVITASWFPVFALYAGAPLFLYDRTAASESGPLLRLDRTPEVQITARTFSVSSMIWFRCALRDSNSDPQLASVLALSPTDMWAVGSYDGVNAEPPKPLT